MLPARPLCHCCCPAPPHPHQLHHPHCCCHHCPRPCHPRQAPPPLPPAWTMSACTSAWTMSACSRLDGAHYTMRNERGYNSSLGPTRVYGSTKNSRVHVTRPKRDGFRHVRTDFRRNQRKAKRVWKKLQSLMSVPRRMVALGLFQAALWSQATTPLCLCSLVHAYVVHIHMLYTYICTHGDGRLTLTRARRSRALAGL